jgi:hypothetical protein
MALLAVLIVIGALAAPNLFGGGGGESAGSNNPGKNNAKSGGNEGGSNAGSDGGSNSGPGGGGGSQGPGGDQTPSPTASASAVPSASAGNPSNPERGKFTPQAAEATVQDFYTTTTEGEYGRSARLLSDDWRNSTFPNRGVFEGTFDKVESVTFIRGPSAEVSGNKATVTGETQARLTGEVQRNQGTWYLVEEGGRWKINSWDVVKLSSRPA